MMTLTGEARTALWVPEAGGGSGVEVGGGLRSSTKRWSARPRSGFPGVAGVRS